MNSSNIIINSDSGETKLQQLINELLRLIQTQYSEGDVLPSVNMLSKKLNISRDTVFKAYSALKQRKIVGSNPAKGYFVERKMGKVLLILDYYTPFKDIFYREIEKNLNGSFSIDLVFHHYNRHLFDSVILESIGQYNSYIVMNIDTQKLKIADVFKKIDPAKLLLIDIPIENWKGFEKTKYNYLWQNFNEAVYQALIEITDRIKQYKIFKLVNPKQSQHPAVTIKAYEKFCNNFNIKHELIENSNHIDVNPGDAYFVLRQSDLHNILSQCKEKKLDPGKDIGIVAYNDFPLYEFVSCGISVIFTDFKKMGEMASKFVTEGNKVQEILPTNIILRNSL